MTDHRPEIDPIDARILDTIQRDFPLVPHPFAEVADRVSLAEDEVISRIIRLKSHGIIRQISAIFDSHALGYRSSLVAFKVTQDQLDQVAQLVSAHEGVSHCYSRDASYNLWFTITVGPDEDLNHEVKALAQPDSVESSLILPAIKVYKIGVFLRMGDDESAGPTAASDRTQPASELTKEDREAVRTLQRDLPLVASPFQELANDAGMKEADLLSRARNFLDSGKMRRFAAVLRHTRAGYHSNAMVCWKVEEGNIDETGAKFAAHPAVSHCYRRPTSPDWPYPLYTMVHCRTTTELDQTITDLAHLSGLQDYLVLHSLREYKKTRVTYFKREKGKVEREK